MRPTAALLALVPALALPLPAAAAVTQGPPNAPYAPAFAAQTRAPELPATAVAAETLTEALDRPWGLARLPDGRLLVTEKPGRLRLLAPDGTLSEPLAGVPEVVADGQGGLLDVAVSPGFATDRLVAVTYAKPLGDGLVATAAALATLSADGRGLEGLRDVFVQAPGSPSTKHYGARVLFDADGSLVITTGEHADAPARELAQDVGATWGKVVRVGRDGAPVAGAPFPEAPLVVSLGHRNPQGAAFDAAGTLWVVEHGPLGGDELNRIAPGANYGWPVVSYGLNYDGSPVGSGMPRAPGYEEPVYYWDPVIAPSGMTVYRGTLFEGWQGDVLVAGLQAEALVRLRMEDGRVAGEARVLAGVGRVRDVEEMADGALVVILDDGRALRLTPG